MRFLIDECCHRLFVTALRDAGHDVRYAAETDRRSTDLQLSALAAAEDRILVTADYDFGELAVRHRRNLPGVVLLSPSDIPIERQSARLISIVESSGNHLGGRLTIVEATRLRFRPLEFE